MIVFDQELRQFSVVDETREFGGVVGIPLVGKVSWGREDRGIKGIVRSAQGKDTQSVRSKNDKRAHKERMAMIKMGMDPSKLESQTVTQDRMRYEDRADRRSNKTSRYEARQDARAAKLQARMEDRADRRDYKLNLAPEKTKQLAVKKLS